MNPAAQIAHTMLHENIDGEPDHPLAWFELSIANGSLTERERAGLFPDSEGHPTMFWRVTDDGLPDRSGPRVTLIDTNLTETGYVLVTVEGTDAYGDDLSGHHVWTSEGEFVELYR